MFEQLYNYRGTIRRHQEGPLAKERIQYLAFKAEGGSPRSTLVQTAPYLLTIASRTGLANKAKVSIDEIEMAASRWARRRRRKGLTGKIQRSKKPFTLAALGWFRFLNRLALPQTRPEPYGELISGFTAYMANERGLSPRTIVTRCWYVRKFLMQLIDQGGVLDKVNVRTMEEYLSWLSNQGYTRGGIRAYAQGLRVFLHYAERQGACPVGVAAAIVAPRVFREERLPSAPNWTDVQRLFASIDTNHPKDIRDRAILMLLATYALRVDQVRQLRLEDIDWERELIVIPHSKQRGPRTYPLAPALGGAILNYLKKVRPRSKDRTLFLTMNAPHRAFGVGGLWPIVGRRLRKLNIVVQHPGPHCLRHACATHLLTQGLSLKEIGDHLGHVSSEATRIYAKVDLASLREVADFDLGGLL